jgi:hypothetical protein
MTIAPDLNARQDAPFQHWLRLVDSLLVKRIGITHRDMPDILFGGLTWRDMHDENYKPIEAVSEAIAAWSAEGDLF